MNDFLISFFIGVFIGVFISLCNLIIKKRPKYKKNIKEPTLYNFYNYSSKIKKIQQELK